MNEKEKSLWEELKQELTRKGFECAYKNTIYAPCGAEEEEVIYYNSNSGIIVYAESLKLSKIYSIRIYAELEANNELVSFSLYQPSTSPMIFKMMDFYTNDIGLNHIWKEAHFEVDLNSSFETKRVFIDLNKLQKCTDEFKKFINIDS